MWQGKNYGEKTGSAHEKKLGKLYEINSVRISRGTAVFYAQSLTTLSNSGLRNSSSFLRTRQSHPQLASSFSKQTGISQPGIGQSGEASREEHGTTRRYANSQCTTAILKLVNLQYSTFGVNMQCTIWGQIQRDPQSINSLILWLEGTL